MQKIEQALGIAVANMMFSTLDNKEEMMQTIHDAHDELSEIKELLKSIEFCIRLRVDNELNLHYFCPKCHADRYDGHEPDCKLAKFMPKD